MSMLRTAHYSAAGARYCKINGHRWDGDTCAGCRIKRDSYTSPYTPGVAITSGVGVGLMEPIIRHAANDQPKRPPAVLSETCQRGHTGQYVRDTERHRYCRQCKVEQQRDVRARRVPA